MARAKPYILLTPGPVPLSADVRQILSEQSIYHRGSYFQQTLAESKKSLSGFFQTQESVMILTSTGTGAMEAAISNTLSPGDTVLCICAGKFGERWQQICLSLKLEVKTIDITWGESASPQKVESYLEKNKNIKAVFVSACETSTATNQDIQSLSKILKTKPEILFVVDGITGLGSMNLPMDEWNIDVLVGGSQKSFSLPTGLSFIALSQKAWGFQKKSKCSKYYFDLEKIKTAEDKGQSAFSINANFLKALNLSLLDVLTKQGLQKRILRCEQLALATHTFAKEIGLSLFSKNPATAVTALNMPDDIDGSLIKKAMEEKHNIIVAGGQEKLKGKIIRFGHLGNIQDEDLLSGLGALAEELHILKPSQFPINKIEKSLEASKQKLKKIL